MDLTIPQNLWAVFRELPGEPPALRAVSLTAEKAAKSCDLESYKIRDLEGYEDVSYCIAKYKHEEGEVGRVRAVFEGSADGQVVVAATGEVRDASAIELGKITEAQVLRDVQAVIHESVAGNPVVAPEKLAEWLAVYFATSRTIDAERLAEMRRLTVDLAEARRLRKLSEDEVLDTRDKILRAAGVSVVELSKSAFETEGREIGSPLLSPSHVPQGHSSGWCEECVCYHP